jgi:amyloid beta precursor protein binding protein 1
MEDDTVQLKASLNNVAIEAGVSVGCVSDDYVGEMVRFGAGELHVVAAIMGGIAAQEAIKLLTCQFIPLKGTLIYNGMSGTSLVL